MTTLLIAEHDNNSISDSVRKAITAAHEIGEQVDILIAGKDCNSACLLYTSPSPRDRG